MGQLPDKDAWAEKMTKKEDIIESILGTDDKEFETRTRELDCLIYKAGSFDPETEKNIPASWKITKENVSVQIWEGRAKIKIKVASKENTPEVSIQRLAVIAVDAIMAELKKEGAQ